MRVVDYLRVIVLHHSLVCFLFLLDFSFSVFRVCSRKRLIAHRAVRRHREHPHARIVFTFNSPIRLCHASSTTTYERFAVEEFLTPS